MRVSTRVLAAYLVLVLLMMWLETLLIFPTWQIPPGDWQPLGLQREEVDFQAEDGTRLHGWYFQHPRPRAHVLYCHGNGEDVSHLGEYMDRLREEFCISVFVFDYRGYGKSEGKPREPGVLSDARAAQQWLAQRAGIATADVVLWGRSIGGAIAVHAAVECGARGIILERTFSSLPEVAAAHYPWLPVRRLMRNRFEARDKIRHYEGPILQSHGTADEIVPLELGKALFEASPSRDKKFVAMVGVTHNGPNTEEYYTELHHFLRQLP